MPNKLKTILKHPITHIETEGYYISPEYDNQPLDDLIFNHYVEQIYHDNRLNMEHSNPSRLLETILEYNPNQAAKGLFIQSEQQIFMPIIQTSPIIGTVELFD